MKIKKITRQNRRDFSAIMICEFCNHESENKYGYDDDHYHNVVIPEMKCKSCGKASGKPTPTKTKYPQGMQV